MSLNRTMLIGNLGKDAEVFNTEKGSFVSFTLAVNETYTSNGVKTQRTDWFTCTTAMVNVAPYLKKGRRVLVEGRIGAKGYQTKEGQNAAEMTLWLTKLEFLSDNKAEEPEQAEELEPQEVASVASGQETT